MRNLFTTEGCHFLTHTTFYQNTNLVSIKAGSTELALHCLVEQYYEAIDSDNFMVGIFVDFSRAFDTISQKMLLTKLQYYGIRGTPLCLFESYLARREQYVCHKSIKFTKIEHQHWNSSKVNIGTTIIFILCKLNLLKLPPTSHLSNMQMIRTCSQLGHH